MTKQARKITVTGRVQGVGYRPFVYNTAQALDIKGSVLNGSGKVFIHAEGEAESLDRLEKALVEAAPPLARPRLAASEPVACSGASAFEILASDSATEAEIHVPPDLFTCDDCLAELTAPEERRFGYPFINCTQCGPRYTIIKAMPYDRPNTSMAGFPLCEACRAEYEAPQDRRFHAQPLACPECGPKLAFVRSGNESDPAQEPAILHQAPALLEAIAAIEAGQVVAVKGVGGYHLVCDAAEGDAVARLRTRKRRPDKPFAVMFPLTGQDGLEAVRAHLDIDEVTAAALKDPARPIVLARKAETFALSKALAPGLCELGAFLPYSPLHHQLLAALRRPIVATSGNISGEPVITDNVEAQRRLAGVADAFLHHDRPIVRPADDPVLRPMAGAARVIRLGRGIAPYEYELPVRLARPMIATGGHLKVTVALGWENRVVVSPHVGELDSPRSNQVFKLVINDLSSLYNVNPQIVVCDLHPGYASTRWARGQGLPVQQVQHHAAHASALAGEHADVARWLVFTWDGVGYGSDGTLWGGEALVGAPGSWRRAASFRPFRLVGGDRAGREPWRSAAALHWALGEPFEPEEASSPAGASAKPVGFPREQRSLLALAEDAWRKDLNTFETSAAGRLFDAAASLVLGRHTASFEGQGPMELEHLARDGCEAVRMPLERDRQGIWRTDWEPLLAPLRDRGLAPEERAGIFHESLAHALVEQALQIAAESPFDAVGLSGGVFQNRRLTERVVDLLAGEGIDVRLHRDIPANDGGLSFGQVIEAMASWAAPG